MARWWLVLEAHGVAECWGPKSDRATCWWFQKGPTAAPPGGGPPSRQRSWSRPQATPSRWPRASDAADSDVTPVSHRAAVRRLRHASESDGEHDSEPSTVCCKQEFGGNPSRGNAGSSGLNPNKTTGKRSVAARYGPAEHFRL